MKYLVSYDLKDQSDYDDIDGKIRSRVDKEAQKVLNTQWIVEWNKTAVDLGHRILWFLNESDSLLVNSLETEDAASHNLKDGAKVGTTLSYPPPTRSDEMNETLDKTGS